MYFRTNRNGQVYPSEKSSIKWNPETDSFNMFTNDNNQSDVQKRKHLEEYAKKTKNSANEDEYQERPEWEWLRDSDNNDDYENDTKSPSEVFSQGL